MNKIRLYNLELYIIERLTRKYTKLLQKHMSLRKEERDADWDKKRTMLFHINGALCMARGAYLTYKNK